jgi:membrane-associated phospholipid phosphatase
VRRALGRLASAQPADLVFLGYVALSGLLIVAFGWKLGPALWIGLSCAHLALALFTLWCAGLATRERSLPGFLRDAYPLFFIAFLYWELRHLALLFSHGYHDATILRLERWLFGEQLAMTLSQRFPVFWLSELMHFFYASYWFLLPLAAALLYPRGRLRGFRELVYAELVVFFACYLVFIFFPVAGPHYEFPLIGGTPAEGHFYRFVHWALEDGGSRGAAFPSSHVAVALTILLVTWRHDRLTCRVLCPFVVGLTVATVYGRFHYGVDALAGLLAAALLVPLARRLEPYLGRAGTRAPGNGSIGVSV